MNLALTESNTVSSHLHTLYITYLKWPSTHKNSFFFFFYKLRIICAKTGSALPHILKKRLIVDYTSHGCSFQQTTCSLKSLRHGKTPIDGSRMGFPHLVCIVCGWIPTHIMCIRTTELFVATWPAGCWRVVGVTELTPFAQFHCMIREGGGATRKCWPARQKNPVLIFTYIISLSSRAWKHPTI